MSVRRVGAVMSSYPTRRMFVSRGNEARVSRVRVSHFSHAVLPDSDRSGEASRASAVARAMMNSSGTTVVECVGRQRRWLPAPNELERRVPLPAVCLPSVSVSTRSPLSMPQRCDGSVRQTTESASIGDGDEVDTLILHLPDCVDSFRYREPRHTASRLQRLVLDRLVDVARRLADGLVDVVVDDLRRVLRGPQLVGVVRWPLLPATAVSSSVERQSSRSRRRGESRPHLQDEPPAVVVVVSAEQRVVDETRLIACRSGHGYNEAVPDQVPPDAPYGAARVSVLVCLSCS